MEAFKGAKHLETVYANAECLATKLEVEQACDRMADEITEKLSQSNPILIGLMTGGIVVMGMLLTRLRFPLQVDYVHVSRYGNNTVGGSLEWIQGVHTNLEDRVVLLVDDLLDRGITLSGVCDYCYKEGALDVQTAVLVTKEIMYREGLSFTTYSGLTLPNRYIFGFGMDYESWFRNAQGIFAMNDEQSC
tara:strand:- start:161 stop:730 length:570 start_codon:yes stop_codon:yes gene_type:complete